MIINGKEITIGLIIDEPWISKILSGEKTWEMRSNKTKIRGDIALIKKGTGHIVGVANLYDCTEYSVYDLCHTHYKKHCIPLKDHGLLKRWRVAWELKDAQEIDPISYTHKQGAVIWVKL